jgi:hypothetical protein
MTEREKIKVQIEGTTPILFNRFRDTQIEGKSKKRTGAIAESDIEDKLYKYEEKICIPSVYLKNCIMEASKQFKIVGKGKSTYSKIVASTVDVSPFMIELNVKKYEVFRISAVNPMTKGRMMTERPKFDKWGCEFEIILNDPAVPSSVINEILEHAGKYVGVGDWRPEKKGMFGKFMITSFKVVK